MPKRKASAFLRNVNLAGMVGRAENLSIDGARISDMYKEKMEFYPVPRTIGPSPQRTVMAKFPTVLARSALSVINNVHPSMVRYMIENVVLIEVYDPTFNRPAKDMLFPTLLKYL